MSQPTLTIDPHPDAAGILARYPNFQVIQFIDGTHFLIVHHHATALVLMPITDTLAEQLCSSDATTISPSIVN